MADIDDSAQASDVAAATKIIDDLMSKSNPLADDKSRTDGGDTCRICRSEGTPEEPLFYPCKCSGSIKYVHQDCLMEWLSHTNKKHCELCKTPFRFTKLYDSHMPDTLPIGVFLTRSCMHLFQRALLWARGIVVGLVWLLLLPWCIRWAWRGSFFMMDAGWARESWIATMEAQVLQNASAHETPQQHLERMAKEISASLAAAATVPQEPLTFTWMQTIWNLLVTPMRISAVSAGALYDSPVNSTRAAAKSTFLSDFSFAKTMTKSAWTNRLILDVLEGQMITILVVVAFVLVFLIREWVVQQQPILNAAAHVREAEQQIERFDRARRQIRGDIQEAEEQIERLDETARQIRESVGDNPADSQRTESPHRIDEESDGLEGHSSILDAPRSTASPYAMSTNWSYVEQIVREASISNTAGSDEYSDVDPERVSQLAREALDLIESAHAAGVTDQESMNSFLRLLDGVRPELRSVWYSELLAQLEVLRKKQVESGSSTSATGNGGNDNQATDPEEDQGEPFPRPTMPLRDSMRQRDRVVRVHEEEPLLDGIADARPSNPTASQTATAESDNGRARVTTLPDDKMSQDNPTMRAAEQQRPSSVELGSASTDMIQGDDVPIDTSGDSDGYSHHAEAGSTSEPSDFLDQRQETPGQTSPNGRFVNWSEQLDTVMLDSSPDSETETNLAQQVDSVGITGGSEDQTQLNDILDEQQSSETSPAAPQQVGPRPMYQRLFDWFWADIVPDLGADEPAPAENEEEIANGLVDDAPFVHIHDAEPEFVDRQLEDDPGIDPEVLAAAAEAGLDAEAVEDAEDMEGVMELIGMQGPILGLAQTAMFCGVLVTITIWGAVGAPYLFGKLALLFLGDPMLFMVILPLQLVAGFGDLVLDTAIVVGGNIAYRSAQVFMLVSSFLSQLLGSEVAMAPLLAFRDASQAARSGAMDRVFDMFFSEPTNDLIESGYLLVSVQAHRSLHNLQWELSTLLGLARNGFDNGREALQNGTITGLVASLASLLLKCHERIAGVLSSLWAPFRTLLDQGTFTMTLNGTTQVALDPSLAYWSATDRFLTVLTGYAFLAMVGSAYLLRTEPIFSSPALQKMEKSVADVLKQAGGVLKVILIISIEMLAFPLYCGFLLDIALLPLFEGATIASRMAFASRSPYFWVFSRWFLGTCYMFHFALFVSMCRRIMRSGVLYFIRDPDDPTFHPVRDVLERSVTTQLKKIAFSALVYGALVILCLGGVVWTIANTTAGVFPIHWSSPEPTIELPIDFLFYNFVTPFLLKLLKPSHGPDAVYDWFLRRSARALRLSHFLFGERKEDEEGRPLRSSWWRIFGTAAEGTESQATEETQELPSPSENSTSSEHFQKNGKYVRAPASDQVRIPKGTPVFVDVTEKDVREDESGQDCQLHGKPNQKFRNIYVPPWFRVRVGLFLVSLWLLSAAFGASVTIIPLIIGRTLCSAALPGHVRLNDIYAFTVGIYLLGCLTFIMLNAAAGTKLLRDKVTSEAIAPLVQKVNVYTLRAFKSLYVYGFGMIVVPGLLALVLQLYVVVPLHTYISAMVFPDTPSAVTTSVVELYTTNSTIVDGERASLTSLQLAQHTVHIMQDGALGVLYARVVLRVAMRSRNTTPAAAFRQITRNGYFDPDLRLATRAFVFPAMLFFSILCLGPLLAAATVKNVVLRVALSGALSATAQTKLYRYSYPLCASLGVAFWSVWALVQATQKWRKSIRDEVYLIGERLHNFGEKKPPSGSKSVARKERG